MVHNYNAYIPTNIGGSNGVHILAGEDPVEEGGGLYLLLAVQGHLDHHSVDVCCLVQVVDTFEQLFLGDARRQVNVLGLDPDLL